jgi:hypothetical protein
VLLLAAGQAADLLTTRVDMSQGAIEGNSLAAALMSSGGLRLLMLVKVLLVAAMAVALFFLSVYTTSHPGARARLARQVVWRGLQLCVIVLAATALHNVVVLAELQGWTPPGLLSALPFLA